MARAIQFNSVPDRSVECALGPEQPLAIRRDTATEAAMPLTTGEQRLIFGADATRVGRVIAPWNRAIEARSPGLGGCVLQNGQRVASWKVRIELRKEYLLIGTPEIGEFI